MSGVVEDSRVKDSLFQFIKKNIPNADLSVIDDIVLSYVASILDSVSNDPNFDLDAFVEVMAGYIPEFADLDTGAVCEWILELEAYLNAKAQRGQKGEAAQEKVVKHQTLMDMVPSITKNNRSHTNSESSEVERAAEERNRVVMFETEMASHAAALHEMFPNTCALEIKHCLHIADGDLERAAATLLHRREFGQEAHAGLTGLGPAGGRQHQADDNELKYRIIQRYSYVDKATETKEHKPLAPKIEPKKMIRYRDNKIVSMKGERYTEVPRSGMEEEPLKKPKKQHCP